MGADSPLKRDWEGEPGGGKVVPAVVAELLPHATCRLTLEDQRQVIAHAASTAARNFVRLRAGDRVLVEISSADRTRGRVVKVLPD